MKDYLKPETAKRLPAGVSDDLTADYFGQLLFLTAVFPGGEVLGFWSHSPCGRCKNQNTGWAVLGTDLKPIESCTTLEMGESPGEDYRQWRNYVRENFGLATRLADACGGELLWKVSEA